MSMWTDENTFILPEELSNIYEIRSCLKYSEQNATYLLRKKSSGRLYLLKTATDPIYIGLLSNEKKILDFIHSSGEDWYPQLFPAAVSLTVGSSPDTTCYIRTYIEGKTLEELCETNYEKPGMPLQQALDYLIDLTDLLRFLHSLNPPLIHRDIKPQNIVVDSEGRCHYIDLGISRFYHSRKRSDTLVMGTQLTAPPEQFGYQQSDTRSDLYSLGILLFYCLTGEYTLSDSLLSELDDSASDIIRRATMFDPDRRYQTADELLTDLLLARYPQVESAFFSNAKKKSRLPRILSALLLSAGLLLIVFAANHLLHAAPGLLLNENIKENSTDDSVYVFAEPLIEEAVRSQLGIADEEPITEEDLEKIVSLHIMGLQIYSDDDDFLFQGNYPYALQEEMRTNGLYEQTGTISSLEDITHMPNLRTLCLYRQQITDISIFEDEELSVSELGLGYNPLTDLTPLTGNTMIEQLNLVGLEISDTTVISTLVNLKELNISSTNIRSLSGLENCGMENLNIYDLVLPDYTELISLKNLTSLEITHLSASIVDALSEIPLTDLFVHSLNGVPLGELSAIDSLESLTVLIGDMAYVSWDSFVLPSLDYLDIKDATIEDFYGLSALSELTTLAIYSCVCESYDGLAEIKTLNTIQCTSEQAEAIRAQYPDADYYYSY